VLVGAAAYVGGRMLNGGVNPLGLGMPLGDGGMVSISVQVTPAPELPTTQPVVIGSYVERKDNSIVVASAPMEAGKGGVVLSVSKGGGEEEGPSTSGNMADGPKLEVVISKETIIYLEDTDMGKPNPEETNKVIQQSVKEGSLDDLTSQSFVTVWGRKSGDRIIAEIVLISNPVIFKRP